MYDFDKVGHVPHLLNLLNGFCKVIEDSHLSKLDLYGGNFTWEKSRGTSAWVRERLDKSFASVSWWFEFPLCKLSVVHTSCSDHEPIC